MKKWYESKLVWLGVLQTVIGVADVLRGLLERGELSGPTGVLLAVSGVATVIIRVWFTDAAIAR